MEIRTKAYGTVDIDPKNIITFDSGLVGFEDKHRFTLLGTGEENTLIWLQSLDDENLAFVVIQPRFFKPDYQPSIKIDDVKDLEVGDSADLQLYTIVVIPQDVKKMTANLRAPIIVNVKNNKAKQLVLSDEGYNVKELVFAEK